MARDQKKDPTIQTRQLAKEEQAKFRVTDALNETGLLPWVLEFRVVGTPHIIQSPGGESVLIGRGDTDGNAKPDIDLNEHNAQYLGVSRRHARIITHNNRVAVQDMRSANGTFINGHLLKPEQVYRLRDADRLRLGLLELQVHFVVQPSLKDDTLAGIENLANIPQMAKGHKVLVVDNHQDVAHLLSHVLERAGFHVVVKEDAPGAITYIDNQSLDLFLIELDLPDMNGLDIVKYLRKQSSNYVPTIAMTNSTGGYKKLQAIEQGVDYFLSKPLALDELLDKLGKIMGIVSKS